MSYLPSTIIHKVLFPFPPAHIHADVGRSRDSSWAWIDSRRHLVGFALLNITTIKTLLTV